MLKLKGMSYYGREKLGAGRGGEKGIRVNFLEKKVVQVSYRRQRVIRLLMCPSDPRAVTTRRHIVVTQFSAASVGVQSGRVSHHKCHGKKE